MKLKEALEKKKGERVKVGAASSFMYCGYVGDDFQEVFDKLSWLTLEARRYRRSFKYTQNKPFVPLLNREVKDMYPSIEGGTIIIIEGDEGGAYWTYDEYKGVESHYDMQRPYERM